MRFTVFSAALLLTLGIIAAGFAAQMGGETTAFTSYLSNLVFRHNFHEVVPGRFYRSSEMSRSDLASLISQKRIRAVIDLRLDDDAPDETGKTEEATAREHGAAYLHIPFASSRADQRRSIERLFQAYDELPTPILVHCSSGTHRSGVASAIWLLDKEHASPAEAMEQLTLRYGFVQIERDMKSLFQGKPTLDRLVSEFGSWADKNASSLPPGSPRAGSPRANQPSGVNQTSSSFFRQWVLRSPLLDHSLPQTADSLPPGGAEN